MLFQGVMIFFLENILSPWETSSDVVLGTADANTSLLSSWSLKIRFCLCTKSFPPIRSLQNRSPWKYASPCSKFIYNKYISDIFSYKQPQTFVLNAYQLICLSHFFSFLIWTSLSVYFINVASILLKIRIIKLLHNLSYLPKQFFPILWIHSPNTLMQSYSFKKPSFCI